MQIDKLFEYSSKQTDPQFVFVLLPLNDNNLLRIYEDIIKPTIESKGLQCKNLHDFIVGNEITKDIAESIGKSRFMIAEITELSPNVMCGLGVSYVLKKEVIVLYQPSKVASTIHFDNPHLQIIQYMNSILGTEELKKRLGYSIEYVMTKAILGYPLGYPLEYPCISGNRDNETSYMLRAIFELRQSRINYFTYYSINSFRNFRQEHVALLQEIEKIRDNKEKLKDTEANHVPWRAGEQTGYAYRELIPYTMNLFNDTKNFIQNGWLVYKFPQELDTIANAMKIVRDTRIDDLTSDKEFLKLIDAIKVQIRKIDFFIEVMEAERKKVGLNIIQR